MGPFGPQNMNPTFVTHGVSLVGFPQIVGTNHLELSVKQQNSAIFDGIAFGLANFEELLKPNTQFSICYIIEENVWKERRTIQLNIKGIRM
jgi:single-stranded-DNA-specific exonuclease